MLPLVVVVVNLCLPSLGWVLLPLVLWSGAFSPSSFRVVLLPSLLLQGASTWLLIMCCNMCCLQ